MAEIKLHNTLTGEKETFVPREPGTVGLYVCGITPYDESHLGHARCYVLFDILKRTFGHFGLRVRHIQNFTDVDDKIIERARTTNVDSLLYPKQFMDSFKDSMKKLNVLPADEYPLVTTHIPEIIALIEKLVAKDLAYEMDGTVYFSVRDFPPYGKLSKRKIDELESGARVEVDDKKRDPLDFALWKKVKPGEPFWKSPWGDGRPGWHIECSAMSMKYLGEEFDIHGGGLDLIFPHHENEIAQSVGASSKAFARVWVHNGFVTVNQEKMSKSLGNFFTLKDIFGSFDPMVVRYFLLSQHYRSPLNFSDKELTAAGVTWRDRICGAARVAAHWTSSRNGAGAKHSVPAEFEQALADDLNTAAALAVLNNTCSQIFAFDKECLRKKTLIDEENATWSRLAAELNQMTSVLGLALPADEKWDGDVLKLVQQREEARKQKEWATSDQIRDQLKQRGLVVEDTPVGPRLKKA